MRLVLSGLGGLSIARCRESMLILPTVNVQPDLPAVVADVLDAAIPQERIWVSCYAHESLHAKINVVLDERNRDQINFVSDGNLKLTRTHETVRQLLSLSATYSQYRRHTLFHARRSAFRPQQSSHLSSSFLIQIAILNA